MEDTEIIDADLSPESKLDFSVIIHLLKSISEWTRLLSILGFVWVTIFIIVALYFGILPNFNKIPTASTPYSSLFFGTLYFIISLLLLLPTFYLYKFSRITRKAIKLGDNTTLEEAFVNLRAHYKYIAVLAIVTSALYIFSMGGLIVGYFLTLK